jgi:callose synthase
MVYSALLSRIISAIVNEIDESIDRSSLLQDFKMEALPALVAKCIDLVEFLVIVERTAQSHS